MLAVAVVVVDGDVESGPFAALVAAAAVAAFVVVGFC